MLVIGRRGLGFAERLPKTVSPLERAEAKRRGTRGWESALWQWLPVAWRAGGRRKAVNRPGAREGPVGAGLSQWHSICCGASVAFSGGIATD